MQGLRGFNFVIDDFDSNLISSIVDSDFDSLNSSEKKEVVLEKLQDDLGGYVLLSVDNSKNLYNLGKMFSPDLAALDLKADGKARRINDAFPMPVPFDIFATMQDEAFVLTAGKDAKSKSAKVASLKASENTPLVSYSLDYGLYAEAMKGVFNNADLQKAIKEDGSEDLEGLYAMEKIFAAMYGYFDTGTVNLRLREDGVAFEYDIAMK